MGPEAVCLGADFIHQVVESGAIVTPPDSLLPEGVAMEVPWRVAAGEILTEGYAYR